tara:strand:+ start:64263 stop:65504 length:1242 start_codon:yes stop_codon:yes gene_type:complete
MFITNYHYLKNKEIYIIVFLFLFSFFSRIPVILLFGDTSLEYEWVFLVSNLIEHGKLVYQTLDNGFLLPNLWMPPLYAYYLYLFSFFNLENSHYILIILFSQSILASISIIFFYKINKIFFSKEISVLSSIIFSAFPLHLYACSQISSISLQVCLTIIFFYYFLQVPIKKNFLSIFFLSFISGLLILLRGEFWAIFLISVIYLFIFFKIPKKQIMLILIISLVVTSPYLIRNYVIFNKITVLQSFGYNLWKGNHPEALKNSRVEGAEMYNSELQKKVDSVSKDKYYLIEKDKIFLNLAIENIKKDPLGYFIFFIKKGLSLILISPDSMDKRYWHPLHYIPVLIIGITSLFGVLFSNKKSTYLNYLILIFLVNIFIFSTVSILPRYKLAILPLQIIFTNVLLERIKEKFFKKNI